MSAKKIVMCGCAETGWYTIRSLLRAGVRFDHFVSLTPEQGAKFQVSGYRDFSDLAQEYHIPVYHPEKYSLKGAGDIDFFRQNRFDLLIQGGWQRLFPEETLATLSIGAVGVHGSPDYLPKGRGRSPLNWSIIEDRHRFIMHLFLIKPGVDDGPVFDTEFFDITPFDTIRTLYYKNSIVTSRMLLRGLPFLLDGSIALRPQTGIASLSPRRTPEDGRIDWEEMDVWQIHNLVRALTRPYPGAFGTLAGSEFIIWRAQVFDTRITYPETAYGEVVEEFGEVKIINCRGGLLLIEDYEPRSRRVNGG